MKGIVLDIVLAICILGFTGSQGLIFEPDFPNDGDRGSGVGINFTCPTAGCPVHCHGNDDPHMRTFDGSYYEMQQEGKFYMYKHSTQPVWVQGFFQSCGYNSAFCSCGAAVRYFGETFIIDKCLKPNGVRANVVAKLGTSTSMQINAYFAGYKISLPGPVEIFLGSNGVGVGTINIVTYPTDLTLIGGLCGNYDGFPSNDFTWRTGEVTPAATPYPYDFADSWRVPTSEDLFIGTNLDNLAPCIEVANATYVPQGVADACFLNITPSAMVDSDLIFEGDFAGGPTLARRKRQTGPVFPDGDWPAGWSFASANEFCTNYLFSSQAVIACTSNIPVPVDVNPFIESCARDIQLTGGTSFASTALTALQSTCVATLDAYSISSAFIMENLCPFNCSGNGVCSSGVCICNQGWSGISCSQDTSEAPIISNTAPGGNCQPSNSGESCYAAYVYGGPFADSGSLSAKAVAYQVDNPLRRRAVQVEVVYVSPGVIIIRIRVRKCAWPRRPFVLVVSISNNGVNYSSVWSIAFNP